MGGRTDRQTEGGTDRQTEGGRDRQIDRQKERQTDKGEAWRWAVGFGRWALGAGRWVLGVGSLEFDFLRWHFCVCAGLSCVALPGACSCSCFPFLPSLHSSCISFPARARPSVVFPSWRCCSVDGDTASAVGAGQLPTGFTSCCPGHISGPASGGFCEEREAMYVCTRVGMYVGM